MQKRLAFSTLGSPEWSFERTVQQAGQMGFAAMEVRGIEGELRVDALAPFQPDGQVQTKRLLADVGVRICSVGTSATFDRPDRFDASIEEGNAALAVCHRMGIPAIRVFGDKHPEDAEDPKVWTQIIVEGLKRLCDEAEALGGLQVWLEVHGHVNTVEALEQVLRQVGQRPAFGLIWDIQHSFRAVGNDFLPFYRVIQPYIRHLHIKDAIRTAQGLELVLPGEGEIDIPGIVHQVLRDGYQGYFSFEWEKRWHPGLADPETAFPAYVAYMQSIVSDG